MIAGEMTEVREEPLQISGARDVTIRWLIGEKEGADIFFTRYVTIKKGGVIPLHAHPQEHQQFVVEGQGVVFTEERKVELRPGSFVYIRGGEKHGMENTGDNDLGLICCVDRAG
jgi:quercetin dioxygenase-like cupin family protein